jgi:hypothetical protein
MVMQPRGGGGVMLQQDKYILGNYGIKNFKGHLWAWEKIDDVGVPGHDAPFHILHSNHRPCH